MFTQCLVSQEDIDYEVSNHSLAILNSLTTWDEMTLLEDCEGKFMCNF